MTQIATLQTATVVISSPKDSQKYVHPGIQTFTSPMTGGRQ